MTWQAQDPILVALWNKGNGADFISQQISKVGPFRRVDDVYSRVVTLRKQGVELTVRPKKRGGADIKFGPSHEAIEVLETRVDELGRTVTVCPPRWCQGARRTWWE